MNWLTKLIPTFRKSNKKKKSKIPDGIWSSCPSCESALYQPELEKTLYVCPKCDHHLRIGSRLRLEIFFDDAKFTEIAAEVSATDFLNFKDTKKYTDRIVDAQKKSGETEALLVGSGKLNGRKVTAAAFEFNFMGGSMGSAVGEKFVQGVKVAMKEKTPFICFATSGGARMQESMISLMQMAKTSAVIQKFKKMNLPYISVMVDPIFGGVSASLAMLGDINIAEPKAFVGFAGRRVIEQTVRVELPEDFQKSEFLLAHGAVDMIVHRTEIKSKISGLLEKIL
ncbi:MAG: acetyl-CoA carboxylase, carboxyltransferase subunit beta [Pseudomonadota bacterium]|nr:acetyl-CoA carboxylase, carboxyltransferase subunit beta [Pseudomonadota bacterium]